MNNIFKLTDGNLLVLRNISNLDYDKYYISFNTKISKIDFINKYIISNTKVIINAYNNELVVLIKYKKKKINQVIFNPKYNIIELSNIIENI